MITRVRAVLITPGEGLLLIRHTWPGGAPYWVFPGGHVEPSDPDLRAALVREVREEVGADPQITGLLWVLADEHQRQHFYLGRIERWSEEDRTGPEFDDPDHGEYQLEEIALTAEAVDAISIEPEDIAGRLRDVLASGADLATMADSTR
jgi:ADP-ribose pyrophosphatase YjhB (NUDIX family)